MNLHTTAQCPVEIISYLDTAYFSKNCTLQPITEPSLLARIADKLPQREIPAREFAAKKLRKQEYSWSDYTKDFPQDPLAQERDCHQWTVPFVATADGQHFYWIEGCTKRPWSEPVEEKENNALVESLPSELLEGLKELPLLAPTQKSRHVSSQTVSPCEGLPLRGFVTFYNKTFWISKCILHEVKDFDFQMQQEVVQEGMPIQELTQDQFLKLKRGTQFSHK